MKPAIICCLLGTALPGFACEFPLWRRYLVSPDGSKVLLRE